MSFRRLTRRAALTSAVAALASTTTRRCALAGSSLILDDASQLNPTPVAKNVVVGTEGEAQILKILRQELKEAAAARRPVAMGVARHSMGGQSLARDGTAFTFSDPVCEPDRVAGTYRATAGTRWRDVIATLDPIGFSPTVMQSNNDFGVASTFSVNAHGWAVPHPPFGSTVRSLRMMLADGSLVTCSRTENAELFRYAMGGYGLFGVIIDLDVEMTPNLSLLPTFEPMAAGDFAPHFVSVCNEPGVAMAYGRLDISRDSFCEQALLISYRPGPAGDIPAVRSSSKFTEVSRFIYRMERGSEWAKQLRWYFESDLGPRVFATPASRNTLLDEPVANLASYETNRTDILHEYFIPPENFPAFVAACREVIPKSRQELLNVTLRYLTPDRESVLAFAPTQRVSAVMSFPQLKTAEADADMQQMTRYLIDRVLAIGGSFYLPYRLHARGDQVAKAYPAVEEFVATKRRYDPGLLFRNALWDTWLAG